MAYARLVGFVLVGASVGCAARPLPSAPAPAPASSGQETAPSSFEGSWGTFHSKRFELSLGLPDGARWKIDDHHTPWLRATHDATHSAIALRTWSEDDNVTRQRCYARAREWDSTLPDLDGSALVDDGLRKMAGGSDARVAVGVTEHGATHGFVVAVIGSIRRCTVLAFGTEASGPSAADEVAARLAVVTERLLPSVKLDPSFAPSRESRYGSPIAPIGGAR